MDNFLLFLHQILVVVDASFLYLPIYIYLYIFPTDKTASKALLTSHGFQPQESPGNIGRTRSEG